MDSQAINDYISSKYGLKQRQDLQNQLAQENEGPNWRAGLAALGTGIAGGNAAAAGQAILNQQAQDQKNRLGLFDQEAEREKNERLGAEENDPNSQSSILARKIATDMGVDPTLAQGLTASRFSKFSPILEKKYRLEQDKLSREDALKSREEIARMSSLDRRAMAEDRRALADERLADRKAAADEKLADKMTEREYKLKTPFGLANTEDDAKKLKDASELKNNFDNKLDQMIALRQKHGGGAALNREDVARGKQLSKDLLLEYKNLAKLGVLSQSDENIINAIIPEDPLEYNSPLAFVQGQDPTLSRLKSFKEDSNKDFSNRIATRTRTGNMAEQPSTPSGAPKAGQIEDGYQFQGGDPKDPKNWVEIKDTQMAQRE